jgi:hypothetical protein
MLAFCLFAFAFSTYGSFMHDCEESIRRIQWILFGYLAVWCGIVLSLTFCLKDLLLTGFLFIAAISYFLGIARSQLTNEAILLFSGATVGKSALALLRCDGRGNSQKVGSSPESGNRKTGRENPPTDVACHRLQVTFLFGLVLLLTFASWWHLDMPDNFYQGPRWMGLWNNPNDYGLLMAAGLILAIGLLAPKRRKRHKGNGESEDGKWKMEDGDGQESEVRIQGSESRSQNGKRIQAESADGQDWRRFFSVFHPRKSAKSADKSSIKELWSLSFRVVLMLAAFMMGTGLLFSYSRGAWIGMAIGLLYLAKAYGKFKWRWVLPPILIAAATIWLFWNTPRTAPWYFQRLDMSRGSVQHRVAAWKAGFEIMWDHPFGVGWNKTVETYQHNYSPPEDGAAAITTNDYLMLGTQLGWPGLLCFLFYAVLCFRKVGQASCLSSGVHQRKYESLASASPTLVGETPTLLYVCRAGALAMLVAFWFDGGLFKLATASVFWILLELGRGLPKKGTEFSNAEDFE